MHLLIESGYVQDGLKAFVYLVPLVYLIARRKSLNLKYFWLFLTGLSLLFFGQFLDLLDEIEFLRELFPSEGHRFLQDFLEDIIGSTLGFVAFILALYLEVRKK